MERSWWWKAVLYGALTVLAGLYLIPTIYSLTPGGEESEPALLKKYFSKKIQLGLDLQGGLHLVYEVNVDKAVASKVDRLASDLEARLRKDKGVNDVMVTRESRDGHEDIVLAFKNPAEQAKLDDSIMRDQRRSLDV